MKLVFGSDHAGLHLRTSLAGWARENGHECDEVGAQTADAYDYPDASDAVASAILGGAAELGVLICGSGIGVSIRANRHRGIRAALCCTSDAARLARLHNHANVLCMGERSQGCEPGLDILRAFLTEAPDLDERHLRRVRMLDA